MSKAGFELRSAGSKAWAFSLICVVAEVTLLCENVGVMEATETGSAD